MRSTVAEIDLGAIAFNFRQVRQRVHPAGVMAVVKADAYGHGAIPVAKRLVREGAGYLGVALVEEGIELREAGVTAPVLVFGSPGGESLEACFEHDLSITLCTREQAEAVSVAGTRLGRRIRCHLNVDTGMGRIGFPYGEAVETIRWISRSLDLDLEGIYTHFATSDARDKGCARLQLDRFHGVLDGLSREGIRFPLRHASNSGAILDLPDADFDLVRPGVMLYGYYPSFETTESLELRPAMTFRTRVAFVKKVPAGTGVSYGRTHVCSEDTAIATLPVGYADGYNRLLSGRGRVRINGVTYPVAGRICMDMIMVDVGKDAAVRPGDEAVLFGPDAGDAASVYALCRLLHTIPYEVTCWVSRRVPRIYKE